MLIHDQRQACVQYDRPASLKSVCAVSIAKATGDGRTTSVSRLVSTAGVYLALRSSLCARQLVLKVVPDRRGYHPSGAIQDRSREPLSPPPRQRRRQKPRPDSAAQKGTWSVARGGLTAPLQSAECGVRWRRMSLAHRGALSAACLLTGLPRGQEARLTAAQSSGGPARGLKS